MNNYLAVVKVTKNATPMKIAFCAEDHKQALAELARATFVSTTMELHEYDLMEVVRQGYIPVAAKISSETYLYRQNLKDKAKDEVDKLIDSVKDVAQMKETTYTPYTVGKAM